MIGRASLALALAVAAGADTAGAANQSRAATSHCRTPERVVYSCRFGRKTASLCLSKRALHYRFGLVGRPEIDLASAPDWSNVRTHQLYSQAFAQSHVRMTSGSISYIVHFGETGFLSDVPGRRISGVMVIDGPEKVLAGLECKGRARIDSGAFAALPDAAPQGWTGAEDEGGPFDAYF